jgi:daunorubicin resistance ABC transporter ATP-binding subunit
VIDVADSGAPAVEVAGLVKSYGAVVAIDGLDLRIEAGTVFGLLGPNGAGKTTLVRVLATLLRPSAGRARVLGFDVVSQPLAVRRRIGLAGQFAAVDQELTGRENLEMIGRLYRLSAGEARIRSREALERFDLAEAADRRVSTYSGGMRRRLDLGASLVGRPPVMLLDEPTAGLDPRARQQLWQLVEQLRNEGTTILLTTQYLEEADRLAQQIAVIDHGQLAAQGTAAQLKATVGSQLLAVRVSNPARTAEAAAILADLAGGEQPAANDAATGEIRVPVTDPGASAEAIRRLDARGILVATVQLQQPSLDDVFLTLTGHAAEPPNHRQAQEETV